MNLTLVAFTCYHLEIIEEGQGLGESEERRKKEKEYKQSLDKYRLDKKVDTGS